MVTRAVEISWKLDRVRRALELRREALHHADADRLAQQAEEVVALGRRLYWDRVGPLCLYPHTAPATGEPQRVSDSGDPNDPDDPGRIVVRLEAMTLGCAWLLDRWGELRDILEDGLLWQPSDRLKAIRMLGRQPLEAVDDRRVRAIYLCCWARDPEDQYGFTDLYNELTPRERTVYLDRLNARESMADMPASLEAARSELLALIAAEEERLEAALAGHLEREEAEAAAELAFDDSAWGERLRRYEVSNDKTLLRIIETLRKRQEKAGATTSSGGRASVRAGGAPPERIESPEGPASASAGSDPLDSAAGDEREADSLTQEEILARLARIVQALGASRVTPAGDAKIEAPAEVPAPGQAHTEPRHPGDPGRVPVDPTLVAAGDIEVPPSVDQDSRNPTNDPHRPAPPARMVAGAILALFALIFFAGFPRAAARSSVEPPAAKPDRLMGRILARGLSETPIPNCWLCSSRAPERAVGVLHGPEWSSVFHASNG